MHKDQVEITTPCGVDWNGLSRRGNARFCGQCTKLVHDLSSLTEDAARALLQSASGELCVRYLYDATGKIHFSPKAALVPASRLSWRGLARAASLSAPLLMQACGGNAGGYDPWPVACQSTDPSSTASTAPSTMDPTTVAPLDGGVGDMNVHLPPCAEPAPSATSEGDPAEPASGSASASPPQVTGSRNAL
jgi:hypothetical protein